MSESTLAGPASVAGAGIPDAAGAAAAHAGGSEAAVETVGHPVRTFIIVGTAMFMAQLDNLVVTSALPSIQKSLHAGLSGLQWTISAYTLTFAVFLLTGAALGDRFGRKRLFGIGLTVFTLGSVGSALAPSIGALIADRMGWAERGLEVDLVRRAILGSQWAVALDLTLRHRKVDLKDTAQHLTVLFTGGIRDKSA